MRRRDISQMNNDALWPSKETLPRLTRRKTGMMMLQSFQAICVKIDAQISGFARIGFALDPCPGVVSEKLTEGHQNCI